jgi:hypothetical protein
LQKQLAANTIETPHNFHVEEGDMSSTTAFDEQIISENHKDSEYDLPPMSVSGMDSDSAPPTLDMGGCKDSNSAEDDPTFVSQPPDDSSQASEDSDQEDFEGTAKGPKKPSKVSSIVSKIKTNAYPRTWGMTARR